MTRIDKYLDTYLSGSISDAELQEFQELLEQEPHLRAELSETLELRSMLHDDLLAIEVPEHLSAAVARNVGTQFATLQYAEEEEEEKRRGAPLPFLISGRMAGSMAVAMLLLLVVGLTPTLNPIGSERTDAPGLFGTLSLENVPLRGTVASDLQSTSPVVPNRAIALRRVSEQSTPETNALNQRVPASDPGLIAANDLLEPVPTDETFVPEDFLDESSVATVDLPVNVDPIGPLGGPRARVNPLILENGFELTNDAPVGDLERSLSAILKDVPAEPRDGFAISLGGQSDDEQIPVLAAIDPHSSEEEEGYQRVMLGGTLASGMTSSTSTLSLEGSAYLAFGLGENSRIGLEGGSTTFRYRRNVAVEILTPTNQVLAGKGVVSEKESSSPIPAGAGSGGGGDVNSGGEKGVNDPLGNPIHPGEVLSEPDLQRRSSRTDGYDVSYGLESYDTEASMAYGLVFYDHTVTSLSDRLNLNGRLGVGGTDGGIVVNARAYAAISTHRNIAWTVGVGASTFHEFERETDFNANYSLNAGLQLGF